MSVSWFQEWNVCFRLIKHKKYHEILTNIHIFWKEYNKLYLNIFLPNFLQLINFETFSLNLEFHVIILLIFFNILLINIHSKNHTKHNTKLNCPIGYYFCFISRKLTFYSKIRRLNHPLTLNIFLIQQRT